MVKISLVSLTLAFLLVILLPLIQSPVSAQDDLVTKTCKHTPFFELCVTTLRADPRSKHEDVAGLGLIVVAATKGKAAATSGQIKKLLGTKPQLKGPLSECAECYKAVLKADIPEAKQALRGDPKFAENGMADTAIEADNCESGFGPSEYPLTAMNKAVHDLAVVARAIIRMLL